MDSEIYYLPIKKSHQTGFCSGDPDLEELGRGAEHAKWFEVSIGVILDRKQFNAGILKNSLFSPKCLAV